MHHLSISLPVSWGAQEGGPGSGQPTTLQGPLWACLGPGCREPGWRRALLFLLQGWQRCVHCLWNPDSKHGEKLVSLLCWGFTGPGKVACQPYSQFMVTRPNFAQIPLPQRQIPCCFGLAGELSLQQTHFPDYWDLEGILFKTEWSAGMSEVSYTKNKFCRFCGGGRPKGRCMVGGGGYFKVKLWLPQLLAI